MISARPDHARPETSQIPALDHARAGREIGDPGRRHEGPGPHLREGLAGLVLVLAQPVREQLLVAGERRVDGGEINEVSHLTFVIPYQPGTTSRSGAPCWGGKGRAVELVGEEGVARPGHGT